jgi:hypothetical protein
MHRAAQLYRTIAADGVAPAADQLSLTRRLGLLFVTALLAVAVPLGWAAATAGASSGQREQAVLVKASSDDDDDDNSGPGGDDDDADEDDDDDGTKGDTGQARDDQTGAETQAQNTDRPGIDTGVSTKGDTDPGDNTGKSEQSPDTGTRGQTGEARDHATGNETQAQNTDRAGLDTGVSTKGETDPGDHTGQTERR